MTEQQLIALLEALLKARRDFRPVDFAKCLKQIEQYLDSVKNSSPK
jgi:hypothetical protein